MLLRLRDQRGQTSAEYLGVIVLVGLIFAGLLTAGPGVGDMIASGIERAICAVRNEPCGGGGGGAGAGAAIGAEAGEVSDGADEGEDEDGGGGLGHAILDGCGLVPLFGEACDVANGAWYAAEGDWVNAGLSAGSAVPGLGYAASGVKGGKRIKEAADAGNKARKKSKGTPNGGKAPKKFTRGGPGPNFPDEILDDPDIYKDVAGAGRKISRSNAAEILAKNMERLGLKQPDGTTAHHIIAFEAGLKGNNAAQKAAARARDLFNKWGIDINSAANGVYLDTPFHRVMHTEKYHTEVANRLAQATSREEAIEILHDIREELIKNTFPY